MSIGLTARQTDCLGFLRSYSGEHGRMPTYRLMAGAIGVTSINTVSQLLHGLEARGAIRRMHGRARAIEIIKPHICPHCGRAPPGGG